MHANKWRGKVCILVKSVLSSLRVYMALNIDNICMFYQEIPNSSLTSNMKLDFSLFSCVCGDGLCVRLGDWVINSCQSDYSSVPHQSYKVYLMGVTSSGRSSLPRIEWFCMKLSVMSHRTLRHSGPSSSDTPHGTEQFAVTPNAICAVTRLRLCRPSRASKEAHADRLQ